MASSEVWSRHTSRAAAYRRGSPGVIWCVFFVPLMTFGKDEKKEGVQCDGGEINDQFPIGQARCSLAWQWSKVPLHAPHSSLLDNHLHKVDQKGPESAEMVRGIVTRTTAAATTTMSLTRAQHDIATVSLARLSSATTRSRLTST